MPCMLGAFGAACTPQYRKKLTELFAQQVTSDTLHAISLGHGIVMAGHRTVETYQHDQVIALPAGHGLFVGTLFDRTHCRPVMFTPEQAQAIIANHKFLTEHYWGRYAGILNNRHSITLVRDPQGLATLFYAKTNDGIVFASELWLLYQALDPQPTIDLNYFAQHLIHTNHALPSTPFIGVNELLPGMELTINIDGSEQQTLLWDVAAMRSSFIADEHGFEEELLATLRACTKAWVNDTPGVCVELSGGTDSSGVMILLRDVLPTGKNLIGVNYIDSQISSSNEIHYAQETADACNAPLHFLDWQNTSLLDSLPADFLPNRPSTLFLCNNIRKQLHALAQQNNCPVIMNGQGGDHVFCAPPPQYALADYWLERGIRGITTPLHRLSGMYRTSWISLIRNNARAVTGYYKHTRYPEIPYTAYLHQDFLSTLTHQDFYLNSVLNRLYPGKATHIESLNHAILYAERNQTTTDRCITHPLLSQPVVELGLKIPTYQSFDSNFDRIFFRRAVSRIKKTKSLWRNIKGQTTGSIIKQCTLHANDMRDIILNGKLANSGIIDKQWVDEQIIKKQHGQVDNLWPLLHLLTGQLWLNQWNLK